MKSKRRMFLIILLSIVATAMAGQIRIEAVHNLIADDIGLRERFMYEAIEYFGCFFNDSDWSPDGKIVATSISIYDENLGIWAIQADGQKMWRISSADDDGPSWSPDGKSIVFTHFSKGNDRFEIWTMAADGSDRRFVTLGYEPAWSRTNRIAFTRRDNDQNDLWAIYPNGSGLVRLTNTPEEEWFPAWSPDGRELAFCSNKDGKFNIYIMEISTAAMRQLTTKEGLRPSWSPDGRWIAFDSIRWQDKGDIWAVRSDKREEVIHLKTGSEVADDPHWSPDGNRILFRAVYKWRADDGLYVMTLR